MPPPEVQRRFTTRDLGDMRYARHRQEALARLGAPEPDARLMRQVHGKAISLLRRDDESGVLAQGDGWLTDRPGAVVGVVVADCVPVWMWERTGKAAGVFHAGWRGLEAGILGAAAASRVIRGATISVLQNAYIEAARAMGAGHLRIMLRHVLPNVAATIIILATIGLGGAILAESALSFLGFGVPPPYPSWGAMLSGSGRSYMYRAPWMAIWPGTAISLAVFGFNMLGDALRDVLDPRLRGAGGGRIQ